MSLSFVLPDGSGANMLVRACSVDVLSYSVSEIPQCSDFVTHLTDMAVPHPALTSWCWERIRDFPSQFSCPYSLCILVAPGDTEVVFQTFTSWLLSWASSKMDSAVTVHKDHAAAHATGREILITSVPPPILENWIFVETPDNLAFVPFRLLPNFVNAVLAQFSSDVMWHASPRAPEFWATPPRAIAFMATPIYRRMFERMLTSWTSATEEIASPAASTPGPPMLLSFLIAFIDTDCTTGKDYYVPVADFCSQLCVFAKSADRNDIVEWVKTKNIFTFRQHPIVVALFDQLGLRVEILNRKVRGKKIHTSFILGITLTTYDHSGS